MQHLILHLPTEARLGGPVQNRWCYSTERMQKTLRANVKINLELKHRWPRLSLPRRRQTSSQHIMKPKISICIIQSLGTILATPNSVNPTSAYSKRSSDLLVLREIRFWISKNGGLLHCISSPT